MRSILQLHRTYLLLVISKSHVFADDASLAEVAPVGPQS